MLSFNVNELIRRCDAKAARRYAPFGIAAGADRGVPLFLEQLASTLRREEDSPIRAESEPQPAPAPTEIGRSAALHGSEMLKRGYTVDQVVHSYGDVCQSITEVAIEQGWRMSTDEFRTLNRCLDNAIADAVAAFALGTQASIKTQAGSQDERLKAFATAHELLLDVAIKSYADVQSGVEPLGATGTSLKNVLQELRALTRRFVSQATIASVQATSPPQAPRRK